MREPTGFPNKSILNLLFVGIKKLIDRLPFGTIFIFFILWISGINIYIVSTEALLFFSFGYYVVKYSLVIRAFDGIKIYDIITIYLLVIAGILFFKEKLPVIHQINIIGLVRQPGWFRTFGSPHKSCIFGSKAPKNAVF